MDGARQQPQVKIRLPMELKSEIEERAQKNFRSVNSEIVKMLSDTLQMKEVIHAER